MLMPWRGGLDDGVLLGVQPAAELVTFAGGNLEPLPQAAGSVAVAYAGWNTIVAGGQNIAIFDQKGANLTSQAGGTGCHQTGDVHEILIPGWALHIGGLPSFSQSSTVKYLTLPVRSILLPFFQLKYLAMQ